MNMDFNNPYRKEMEAAWRLPDGYEDGLVKAALYPLAAFLSKAMRLYEEGEAVKTLGVCFGLLDMLITLRNRDPNLFETTYGTTPYAETLMHVTLYPICKIYKDGRLPQEARKEILRRFKDYNAYYNFLDDVGLGNFKPIKVIWEYGDFLSELNYLAFLGIHAYDWRTEKDVEDYTDERKVLISKIEDEVLGIGEYEKLSAEELSALAPLLTSISRNPSNDKKSQQRLKDMSEELAFRIGKENSIDEQASLLRAISEIRLTGKFPYDDTHLHHAKRFINKVRKTADAIDYRTVHTALEILQTEPLTQCVIDDDSHGYSRYKYSVGKTFYQSTLRQWAATQNADGSWTGISADEAFGRMAIVGMDFGSMEDVDNARVTMLGYNHYFCAPCDTPRNLHAKHLAHLHRRDRSIDYNRDAVIRQAMTMLESQTLTLADRLLLYDIIL